MRVGARILTVLTLAVFVGVAFRPSLPPEGSVRPVAPGGTGTPSPEREEGGLKFRDPFRFAEAEVPKVARRAPTPTVASPSSSPAPPAVTLLGLLRSPRGLEAVLSIEGEVTIVRAGETLEGYTLLALDEDRGARMRDPSGHEFVLPPS
jgi:hypothetical protein